MKPATGMGLLALGFTGIALTTGAVQAVIAAIGCGAVALISYVRDVSR